MGYGGKEAGYVYFVCWDIRCIETYEALPAAAMSHATDRS
jgi:hypothetical protein